MHTKAHKERLHFRGTLVNSEENIKEERENGRSEDNGLQWKDTLRISKQRTKPTKEISFIISTSKYEKLKLSIIISIETKYLNNNNKIEGGWYRWEMTNERMAWIGDRELWFFIILSIFSQKKGLSFSFLLIISRESKREEKKNLSLFFFSLFSF